MNKRIPLLAILGILSLSILGCSGAANPTVYLANGDARIYSGGLIGAGAVTYSTDTGPTLSLSLHNETGSDLTISSVNGFRVQPTEGYFFFATSYSYYYWPNSDGVAYGNPYQAGSVFLAGDLSSGTIPDGGTQPFSVAFNPADSNVYCGGRGESHQSYKIGLSDDEGTSYDFVFEVYGVIAC